MARLNYKEVLKGDVGATYEPHLTDESVLYWTNNGGLENPTPKNIRGKTGLTPNLQIGTVETLESNENAKVEIVGTVENPIINMGIPKGKEQDLKPYQTKNDNDLLNDKTIVENINNNIVYNKNNQSDLNAIVNKKTNKINTDLEEDSYYDENGIKYTYSGYVVLSAKVDPLKQYDISCYSKFAMSPITLWDNEKFIGYMGELNPSGESDLENQNIIITTPINCNKIKIQSTTWGKENKHYIKEFIYYPNTFKYLKNLKWGAIGDSLTDANTLKEQTEKENYVDYVSESLGLRVDNLGVGGTGYWNGKNINRNFPKRTENLSNDYDIITIFGSFNDNFETTNYTLGNVSDKTEETLFGCMNKTLENIYKNNPNVIVGIILPTPWGGWNLRHPSRLEKCKEYINALIEFANYNSLPILDLFHESNLRPWDSEFNSKYFLNADTVHPLSEAHKKFISPKIEDFIVKLIGGKKYDK